MRAFRVARLLDVDIHIHPTFLLIVAWAVARWGFGSDGGVGSLLLGLVFVLLIMVSVVVHELGHVLMAREFGVRVLDVTLWPFGGVARIEQIPAHPRAEFMISLAGPAMKLPQPYVKLTDDARLPDVTHPALVTGLASWMGMRVGIPQARDFQQQAAEAEQYAVQALADQDATTPWHVRVTHYP